MDTKVSNLLVGLFVVVLSALFVTGVLWFSVGGFYRPMEHYLVYMDESVAGLSIDAPVTYLGVDVGQVAAISVGPTVEQVRLLLEVDEATPIKTDTEAVLRMQGVTGLLFIDLVGSSAQAAPLEPQPGQPLPVIPSRQSLMVNLEENISELLRELRTTARAVNALLSEENRQTLATGMEDLSAAFAHARKASEGLPQLVAGLRDTARSLETMAEQFTTTAQNLDRQLGASAADLRRFTRDTLPQSSALVDELYQAARNLRRASEQLERDPSILLFGREPQLGPGE